MVRRNELKLIYTHGHPHLLFDLKNDPLELKNLSEDKEYKHQLIQLLEICKKEWNPEELKDDILKSQRRRLMIKGLPGDPPEWDFIAQIGDEKRYVRKGGVDATKSKLRIPPVQTVPPDLPELDKKTIEQILTGKTKHNF
jgi:choline-sulfatase